MTPAPVPDGIRVVPFADLDDAPALYELDMEVSHDIPNEEFDGLSFEEWRDEFWRSPLIDQDASLVAFVEDELADDDPDRRAQRPRPEQRHGDP